MGQNLLRRGCPEGELGVRSGGEGSRDVVENRMNGHSFLIRTLQKLTAFK